MNDSPTGLRSLVVLLFVRDMARFEGAGRLELEGRLLRGRERGGLTKSASSEREGRGGR